MRIKNISIILITALFLSSFVALPATAFSRTKSHSHTSKSKSKHKKQRNGKKQSVSQSLQRLEQYFSEYANWNNGNSQFIHASNSGEKLFDNNSIFTDFALRVSFIQNINSWLGTPYRHGGHTKKGVDCSNFTSCIVTETLGIRFPASPSAQSALFKKIKDIDELQFGDLIFFSGRNRKSSRIGHVGFFIGNGLFAQSSSGRGVIYTHISEGYYSQRFRHGGRFYKETWAGEIK